MQKRILSTATTAFLFFTITNWGCNKLDTTNIGSDLLPAVDNVTTFDTLITINTTQGVFNLDSTVIKSTDDHALGKITNDPLFGTTTASVYAQFKPSFYPYYYGNANDTINPALDIRTGFDSVVLCLSYKGNFGDSTIPIDLQVREIPNSINNNGLWDSLGQPKNVNYSPITGNIIGSTQVNVANLGNMVVYANHKDSIRNQIRIKLSNTFAAKLFAADSSTGLTPFKSDSLFRLYTNGIAVIASGGGNCLLYTNLTDTSTKLEIHYRRKNGGVVDTTYSTFTVVSATVGVPSSTVNNIVRNRLPQVTNPAPSEIYLQTSPGTYANLNIPDLSTLSNRIIHRAEIIVEQIPTNPLFDNYFAAPNYLYVDLKDTGTTDKWKPIYFDLNPGVGYNPDNSLTFYPGSIDYNYFGGYVRTKNDQFGTSIKYYNINVTRHVQQIVTKKTVNYPMRLYAPFDLAYPQYTPTLLSYANRVAYGRVKVGSGSNANYKMRLRIVYSKI